MKLTMPIVLAQLAIFFGEYVMADDPPIDIRYEERPAGTLVSGSSIPNRIKHQMLIEHYESLFGHNLVQVVSSTDHAILTNASNSFESFKSSEQSRIDRQLVDLCSRRGAMPSKAIALEVDRIYSQADSLREQHFQEIISKLSEQGRTQVTKFIDETISSGMQTIIPPSAVQIQEEDAEDFGYWFELECHRVTTGDYPAEVKELSEQVARQLLEGKIGPGKE